jgi:hypothetical protein
MTYEIIDAFVDGERVDTAALKAALAEPAGRDHLVDAWLLREGVQDMMALDAPADGSPAAMRVNRRWPWAMAAAAVLCLASGFLLGRFVPSAVAPRPAPSPIVSVSPAPTPTAFPAPAPTRVIQMDMSSREAGGGM